MFRCKLPPHAFDRMAGVFGVSLRKHGLKQTPHKSQHRKLTLEKNILQPLLSGLQLATFRSRVRRSTNKLSLLPGDLVSGCKLSNFSQMQISVCNRKRVLYHAKVCSGNSRIVASTATDNECIYPPFFCQIFLLM